jgi:hypothetical protein
MGLREVNELHTDYQFVWTRGYNSNNNLDTFMNMHYYRENWSFSFLDTERTLLLSSPLLAHPSFIDMHINTHHHYHHCAHTAHLILGKDRPQVTIWNS